MKLIHEHNNPADLMTKIKPLLILKTFINRNHINISTTE